MELLISSRVGSQRVFSEAGIGYFDTYAPVARITTIRKLIDMGVIHKLIIHQMDVKTSFLNKELI